MTLSEFDLKDEARLMSVSEALRTHYGTVKVKGMITSLSRLFKMISGTKFYCDKCNKLVEITFPLPVFGIRKQDQKCPDCDFTVGIEKNNFDYINTVTLELQDLNSFNDVDRLTLFLFDKDTENIHIGETVLIEGEMHIDNHKEAKKLFPYLYAKSIQYEKIDKITLTQLDIDAIKRFKRKYGSSTIDGLVKMFDPSIIGYEHVKRGLLLCAANSDGDNLSVHGSNNLRRERIHALLIGETGLAKSKFLRAITQIVPNSRYESGQNSSGKSLTAIVSKEDENYMLRLGPASLAKNAVCAINEFGRTRFEDQAHLLDIMEEGKFTINKHGINASIVATTTIILSANPLNSSSWSNEDKIEVDEIPALKPILDRIDLTFVFRNPKDEKLIREYATLKAEFETKKIPNFSNYIIKHLEFAKKLNPIMSDEAKSMLSEFFVSIKTNTPNFGSNRILDTLFRISKAFAKLNLKNVIDFEDAKETIEFYNVILGQYQQIVNVPDSPRNTTFLECLKILKAINIPVSFDELLRKTCQKNQYVRTYLCFKNGTLRLSDNMKARVVYDMLLNHKNVRRIQEKPVVLQWVDSEYDICDTYDTTKNPKQEKIEEELEELDNKSLQSHTSQISQDNKKLEKCNFNFDPNELPKLITKTGTIFYLCPVSGCKISNIHSEEIIRHLKLKHVFDSQKD